jgi:hypothetical protein
MLTALFSLIFLSSHASYFEECKIKAQVTEVKSDFIKIKVEKIISHDGHGNLRCKGIEKKGFSIKKEKSFEKLKKGKSYQFKYHYYDSMGPNGIVKGESWTIEP